VIFGTGAAADVPEVGGADTPTKRDTPISPASTSKSPAGSLDTPPWEATVPPGVTGDASAERTAQPSLDQNEQLSEPIAEPLGGADEPPVEALPVGDALRVAQLADLVTVRDGHPRYHLAGCPTLSGRSDRTELAVSVARRTGFTPCAVCAPDRTLLARSRARGRPPAG
jgi:hypothetical protein